MLRVLLATDSPEPSGVGEHMLTLAGALASQGVEASLALPDHAAATRLAQRAKAAGLLVQQVALSNWPEVFAQSKADIIHIHAGIGWEGHSLTYAAADTGAAVVRTEHLPWLLTDPAQIDEYAQASQYVDAVITVSHAGAAGWRCALAQMPGPRLPLAAIPNGITARALRKQNADHDSYVILCVGRFTAQKMHHILLVAFARLLAQGIAAQLVLVGTGPLQSTLQRLAGRLKIVDRVSFLGQRDDVAELMAKADILALTSGFEGLPLAVLEAMASELPVVATRIGGTTEALGPDHPWLARPGSSRDFAAVLAAALDDPQGRDAVALAQLDRFRQKFTAERMAADTARLYRAAIRARTFRQKRMNRMKLGFIGAGGIAHRHFDVLETMPDVIIATVADPDENRATEAAQRQGARRYSNYETMLENEELDAVFICVPPFAHGAPEFACIAKNLPFFVEKPLSLDIAVAQKIAEQVETAGLVTAVGYQWRYLDTMDEARAQLAHNPAHLIQGFWMDQTPPPQWWWREDMSGGQMVEQATHLIDAARFLVGDVTEVFSMAASRQRPDFEGLTVATASAVTLRFASGAIANLSATCLLRWNHRIGLHVFSDALALEITDHDLIIDIGRGRPVRHASGDPVWREDRDFIEAVMGSENRIRCPYPEALETHRVALAVSQSAKTGSVIKMEGLRANPQPMFCQAFA